MLVAPQAVPTFAPAGAGLLLLAALQPTPDLYVRVEAQPRPDAQFSFVLPPLMDDCVGLVLSGAFVAAGCLGAWAGPTPLRPGHTTVLPRGGAVRLLVCGSGEGALVFPSHRLLCSVAEEALARPPQRVQLRPCLGAADPLLRELATQVVTLARAAAAGRLHLETLAYFMAVHLLCHYGAAPAQHAPLRPHRPAVDRVIDYIHAHLDYDLSLAELAQVAALSPFHLVRVFKQATGETLHQYVLHRRLDEAMRLLRHSGSTITEVAHAAGFGDHSHFARRFKRRFGLSPTEIGKESKI